MREVKHMKRRGSQNIECSNCHHFGHIARHCKNNITRYLKQHHAKFWKRKYESKTEYEDLAHRDDQIAEEYPKLEECEKKQKNENFTHEVDQVIGMGMPKEVAKEGYEESLMH